MTDASRSAPLPRHAPYVWLPVWLSVLLHSLPWALLLGEMFFYVPRMKDIFADFGVALPQTTILVINLSDLTVQFWYVALILLLIILGADAVVDVLLVRAGSYRGRLLWVLFGYVVPVCLLLVSLVLVSASFVRLLTGLS